MSTHPSISQPGLIPLRWPVANAGPHPISTGIRDLIEPAAPTRTAHVAAEAVEPFPPEMAPVSASPEQDAAAVVAAHVQAVSDMLAEIHLMIWDDRERGAL